MGSVTKFLCRVKQNLEELNDLLPHVRSRSRSMERHGLLRVPGTMLFALSLQSQEVSQTSRSRTR